MKPIKNPTILPAGIETWSEGFSDIIQKSVVEYRYTLNNGYVFRCISYSLEQSRDKRDFFFAHYYGGNG